jgi:hypothetical protein
MTSHAKYQTSKSETYLRTVPIYLVDILAKSLLNKTRGEIGKNKDMSLKSEEKVERER